jgi:hypothetical protein
MLLVVLSMHDPVPKLLTKHTPMRSPAITRVEDVVVVLAIEQSTSSPITMVNG